MTLNAVTIPSIIFLHVDPTLVDLEPSDIGFELFKLLQLDTDESFVLDIYDSLRQLVDSLLEPLTHNHPNALGFDKNIPTISPPAGGTGITPRQVVEHLGRNLPDELLAGVARSLIINSLLVNPSIYILLIVRNLRQIVSFVEQALSLGDLLPRYVSNPEHIRAFQILPDSDKLTITGNELVDRPANSFFPISLQKEYVKPDATSALIASALSSILTT